MTDPAPTLTLGPMGYEEILESEGVMLDAEKRLEAWHERKYGKVKPAATYRKLLEEVGELGEAMMKRNWPAAYEEACDSLAVLTHLLRQFGADLEGALGEAVSKVEKREAAEAGKET